MGRVFLLAFGVGIAFGACAPLAGFVCTQAADCQGTGQLGVCEDTSYCSFPDTTCGSGRRYGALARPDLANVCVEADNREDDGTSGDTSEVDVSASGLPSTVGDSAGADPTVGLPDEGGDTDGVDDGGLDSTTGRPSGDDNGDEGAGETTPQDTGEGSDGATGVPEAGNETGSAIEICDGEDNDDDGLVDEFSELNTECDGCRLAQLDDVVLWACNGPLDWSDAHEDCLERGGDLVSITSASENNAVTDFAAPNANNLNFWIGANDFDEEGVFVWTDGSPFVFDNWRDGEPNNNNNDNNGGEGCAEIEKTSAQQWDDKACDNTQAYICEADHEP